jgi:hypothetical protein
MRHGGPILGALFIGLVLLAVAAAAALGGAPDRGRAEALSANDAGTKIGAILGAGHRPARFVGVIQTATSKAYHFTGPDFDAAVDVATGEIGFVTLFGAVPGEQGVRISSAVAVANARSAISAVGATPPAVEPVVELLDHGTASEYRVTWARHENGVLVPDQLIVRINPISGSWYSVIRIKREYSTPPSPVIDRDGAIARGRASFGATARLESGELVIAFDATGRQRLLWSLLFGVGDPAGYEDGRSLLLDAITGTEIDVSDLGITVPSADRP